MAVLAAPASRRRLALTGLAVTLAVVVAAVLATVYLLDRGDGPFTLRGTVIATGATTVSGTCTPTPGTNVAGETVVVADGKGADIGSTALGSTGVATEPAGCAFPFRVKVPGGDRYVVTIEGRADRRVFSSARARRGEVRIVVSGSS